MADDTDNSAKAPTFTALAFKREGKKSGRWVEIGSARKQDEQDGGIRVYLDRLPIGGFTGYVYLSPIGDELPADPSDDDEETFG